MNETSKHTMKELTKELGITRGRVYQILDTLQEQGKAHKNSNGRYILDDKTVNRLYAHFDKTSIKYKNKKAIDTHSMTIDKLQSTLDAQEKLIDSLKDTIEILKTQNANLISQQQEKDNQIKKLTQLTDQSQRLNLMDKPELKEPEKSKKHWWNL